MRRRLWRLFNPALDDDVRQQLVKTLIRSSRAVGLALRANDQAALSAARTEVDAAKVKLGERGPPRWTHGAPDYNRRMARNTPYADWFAELGAEGQRSE